MTASTPYGLETLSTPAWLDGFSDWPVAAAGHICLPVADHLYALLWPGKTQGSLGSLSARLVALGSRARTVPARLGQRVTCASQARSAVAGQSTQIRRQLSRLGRSFQFTMMMPFKAPQALGTAQDLRAKHAALKAARQTLHYAEARLLPTLAPILRHAEETRALTAISADKASFHLLVRKEQVCDVKDSFSHLTPDDLELAMIGPLAPFSFLQATARGTLAA